MMESIVDEQELTLSTKPRKSKLSSLTDAAKMIAGCKSLHIRDGGAPMALVRELIRVGAKDLTVFPGMQVGFASDLLIAAGCVSTICICAANMGETPALRKALQKKTLKVIEGEEAFVWLSLKAAADNLPFVAVKSFVYDAIDIPKLNPMIKRVKDPYTGEDVWTIPPLKADVSILYADQADEFGNARCQRGFEAKDKAKASSMVIVVTEELVSNDVIRKNPERTDIVGYLVDAVVHLPFALHPEGSPAYYRVDREHKAIYQEMVRGNREKEYLDKFVYGPKDHYDYLDRIGGPRRLSELHV